MILNIQDHLLDYIFSKTSSTLIAESYIDDGVFFFFFLYPMYRIDSQVIQPKVSLSYTACTFAIS